MSSALDMSLDDIIKSNKKPPSAAPSTRGRGARRSAPTSGMGPTRRFPYRSAVRSAPYSKPVQAPDVAWDHDMFAGEAATYIAPAVAAGRLGGGGGSIETGTKLYISNLDYGVSNEDIKELFAEVGDLKRYGIHYDRSGRSKGTADVVFSRREEALAAVKRYNNVMLDGKPMKIEIVGTNIVTPAVVAPAINDGILRNQNGSFRSGGRGGAWRGRGGSRGAGIGRGRGQGRGRGRGSGIGSGRGRGENLSAEDLDADLDKYHAESMHTD